MAKSKTNKDSFCLCVGAGVTKEFVGTWNGLLNDTAKQIIENRWLSDVAYADKDCPSLDGIDIFETGEVLEKGEYLLGNFWEEDHDYTRERMAKMADVNFAEVVKLSIQKKTEEYVNNPKRKSHTIPDIICDAINEKDSEAAKELSTLIAVIRLCVDGQVCHIINYNFDTILEQCLSDSNVQTAAWECNQKAKSGKGRTGKSRRMTAKPDFDIHVWTYGESCKKLELSDGIVYHFGELPECFKKKNVKNSKKREINIYHVHGICNPDIDSMPIVFSEYSYKEFVDLTGNWSSQILMSLLQRFNLRTVGFSGTDTNFRHIVRELKSARESEFYGGEDRLGITLTIAKESYTNSLTTSFKKRKVHKGAPYDTVVLTDEENEAVKFIKKEYFRMMAHYYQMTYGIVLEAHERYEDVAKAMLEMLF